MECAADIQNGLACKGRCEERAIRINKMIDRNPQMIAAANSQVLTQRIISVIVGLGLAISGVYIGFESTLPGVSVIALGLVFLFRGIRTARYPTPDK